MDIASGVALAKQAYDLVKVMMEERDKKLIKEAAGELNEKIRELQMLNVEIMSLYHAEKQLTMKLTDEKTKIEMFHSQSAEYERHKMSSGTIVYRSKPSANEKISLHYLCAHCYQHRVIAILQPIGETRVYQEHYHSISSCANCKTEYVMDAVGVYDGPAMVIGV